MKKFNGVKICAECRTKVGSRSECPQCGSTYFDYIQNHNKKGKKPSRKDKWQEF